jgi:hypothetical protein
MISERSFSRSFDAFWHELLPLLTPQFVALFNEGYEECLLNEAGEALSVLPVGVGVDRPDIVAEFAFRLARHANEQGISLNGVNEAAEAIATAEQEAFDLIDRYEGRKPAGIEPLSDAERTEGLILCSRYEGLYHSQPAGARIQFCPKLQGTGFLNSSEGDISIGKTLIEVKTTTRKASGKDIRQILVYAALDATAGQNRWSHFGIFNPRRATLHQANIESFILRLSGGKPPSDVFAELVSFAESDQPAIERRF